MSEFTNNQVEVLIAPGSLSEFINTELIQEEQKFKIHQHNLDCIKAGNNSLADIYGGEAKAIRITNSSRGIIEGFETAKEQLSQGNSQPAQNILEGRIAELKKIINDSSLPITSPFIAKHIAQLTLLQMLHDDITENNNRHN